MLSISQCDSQSRSLLSPRKLHVFRVCSDGSQSHTGECSVPSRKGVVIASHSRSVPSGQWDGLELETRFSDEVIWAMTIVVLGCMSFVPAMGMDDGAHRYAVVCGVSDYQQVKDLWYSANDATALHRVLIESQDWDDTNVTLLVDGNATKDSIRLAIQRMADTAQPNDVCLFYFSGHGYRSTDMGPYDEDDGLDEYICPYETDPCNASTMIRDEELSTWIAQIRSKHIVVILDTCYAGGHVKAAMKEIVPVVADVGIKCLNWGSPAPWTEGGFASRLVASGGTKDLDDLSSIAVLAGSDVTEYGYESRVLGHGHMTCYLLDAIGAPLADTDNDGTLSLNELYAYLAPRVASLYFGSSLPRQHPQFYDGGAGDTPLVRASVRFSGKMFARVDMETDPRWTTEGGWSWGIPQGLGGSYGGPDPRAGHTGRSVYGYNLNGDYPPNLPAKNLTSTPFDCSHHMNVHLRFWRWLGVQGSSLDCAEVKVSNDGLNWTTVWGNIDLPVSDTEWVLYEYDISTIADGEPTVYLRWAMGPTNSAYQFCGWNIDDVELLGEEAFWVAIESNPNSIASGLRTKLVAKVSGGVPPYVYQWSTGEASQSIAVSPDVTTPYSVIVTDSTGTKVKAETLVRVALSAGIEKNPNSAISPGDPVTLTVKTSGGQPNPDYHFFWSTGQTSQTITTYPNESTSYWVTITDAAGDTVTADTTVRVPLSVSIMTAPTHAVVRSGESIELTAIPTGGLPRYTYRWSTGETSKRITLRPTRTSSYTVTVSDSDTSKQGIAVAETKVIVAEALSVKIHPDPTPENPIPGACLRLKARVSGGVSGYSYKWNTGETSETITVAPTAQTTCFLVVEDSVGQTTADQIEVLQLVVKVNGPGTVEGVTQDKTFCPEGASLSLKAIPLEPCDRFSGWSGDANSTEPVITVVMKSNKEITADFLDGKMGPATCFGPGACLMGLVGLALRVLSRGERVARSGPVCREGRR